MTARPVAVLLRAVNLAGRRLTMADFKTALADLGYPDARTLAASGNAVIRAERAGGDLESILEAGLTRALGAPCEVFVRDHAQLQAVLAGNPFPRMAEQAPHHLLVMFLKGEPVAAGVEAVREAVAGPEEVAAGPACLYVSYPEDIGHSKLTSALIERRVKLRGTGRNWNTVGKLAAVLAEG